MKLPDLEVIAVISNPAQYRSRYELYKIFESDLKQQNLKVRLWTVELQHGRRPAEVTHSLHENHIQLWTSALPGEIWHKENLINYAINHLSHKVPDWRYVAWVDADFKFEPDAFEKTVQALQHYDIVQMWSHLINLGPKGGIIQNKVGSSFMWGLKNGEPVEPGCYPKWLGSPGGAWAARRESLNKIGSFFGGPIIDWGILGAGDLYFACALNGMLGGFLDKKFTAQYNGSLYCYQKTAVEALKKNIGYVENTVRHLFHGRTADRQYESRGSILIKYQFNPYTDLKRDTSGILQLIVTNERQMRLRDACRRYFFSRNEDATTL